MCRLYGVTRAGFYAWRSRGRGARDQANAELLGHITEIHRQSRATYGSPRVHRELVRRGHRVGENRVARLMRAHGIKARVALIRYTCPNMRHYYANFSNAQLDLPLERPDQVWLGDITYLKVGEVYRYLAVVLDKYSRRVLGWAFGKHKDVKLTLKALNDAVRQRRPARGLIFHSDRGIEYAAMAYKQRLAQLGVTQSMNRPGKVTDNAHIESFFHSMKTDIVHGLRFTHDAQMRTAIRNYIPFYNNTRLHSSLDYLPPATYEERLI